MDGRRAGIVFAGSVILAICLACKGGNPPPGTAAAPGAVPVAPMGNAATAPVVPGTAPAPVQAAPVVAAAAVPAAPGENEASAVPRGATVNVDGLEATVLSARLTRRVGRSFMHHEAPEGSTLLVVSYRVRNTTREPIQVLSFADAVIANGTEYHSSMDCSMAVNTLGISATLNPNLPRPYEACFEVPPDTHGWVVKFNRTMTDRFSQTGL